MIDRVDTIYDHERGRWTPTVWIISHAVLLGWVIVVQRTSRFPWFWGFVLGPNDYFKYKE